MLLDYLGLSVVVISCGMAVKWGGVDERLASLGFILATLASHVWTRSDYALTETIVLMIDAALLLGLVVLALRSDRFWPMWAAAFQLVGTTVHFASMMATADYASAYGVALVFWSYPVLIALGVGTWFEGRHRRLAAPA